MKIFVVATDLEFQEISYEESCNSFICDVSNDDMFLTDFNGDVISDWMDNVEIFVESERVRGEYTNLRMEYFIYPRLDYEY